MCDEIPLFQRLTRMLQGSFSRVSTDYNQFHSLITAQEKKAQVNQATYLPNKVLKDMFMNRYRGITQAGQVIPTAMQGGMWAFYGSRCPTLQDDVQVAAKAWVWSQLSLPNLSITQVPAIVAKIGATGMGTTSEDRENLRLLVDQNVRYETKALALSTASSVTISMVLKTAGNAVESNVKKNVLKAARGGWQATGVFAFLYGLSRIQGAMNETGDFQPYLRVMRDDFIRKKDAEFRKSYSHLVNDINKTSDLFT